MFPAFCIMDSLSAAREARRKDLFKSSSDVGTVGSCSNISHVLPGKGDKPLGEPGKGRL
jgi:hypothetical protein